MSSSLTWLDQDAAARNRSLRILALFQEKESRDELGIGGVRDAIADRLFPGTSTIQTRLRYMLLVPWMYQDLERRRVPAGAFAASARQAEFAMVRPLLDAQEEGVFGAQAGAALKRLPSSVYWAGLGAWGIRRYPGSQGEYHGAVDLLYARRKRHRRVDDDDVDADAPDTQTWHPRLPPPPDGFPTGLDMTLTADEASFLRDRIVSCARDSLLAWLVLHGKLDAAPEPWQHHQFGQVPAPIGALLSHARLFTDAMEGAARLYNLCLAELRQDDDLAQRHRNALAQWHTRCDLDGIGSWSLEDLWHESLGQGHNLSLQTRRFVTAWVERVQTTSGKVADDTQGRQLIRERERGLKGPRSRFANRGALAQWGGSSGVGRLVYRWPTARRFLNDLLPALAGS